MPAAIAATRWSEEYELLDAAAAIPRRRPPGGLAAICSRGARGRALEPTLGHPRGSRTARVGRWLGLARIPARARPLRAPSASTSCSRRGGLVVRAGQAARGRRPIRMAPMFEIGTSLREARLRRQIDFAEAEQARRSAASTCARSRRSASSCFPRTRTSRASCGVRRLSRARRPAVRRRVQLALCDRRGGRARARAARVPAARARRAERRESSSSCSRCRDRARHVARDRRVEVRRPRERARPGPRRRRPAAAAKVPPLPAGSARLERARRPAATPT